MVNAEKEAAQLANCFVWPLEDDIDHIFEILHKSTLIKKNGGGCGYNFSNIRPEGDLVGGIPELAVGPVRMIEMFDLMTGMFRQEGRYESGNMAILNADHPDIFKFTSAKQQDGYLPKTNISVGITDEFMEAAVKNKNWDLKNPRTGEVVNTVKAKSILDLMATMAWQTGDPGMINLSAINRGTALANPLLKKRGPIMATNPCGEEPLFAFESCNLGYINFTKFVVSSFKFQVLSKDKKQLETRNSPLATRNFDFVRVAEVMKIAVRFMDNVVTASWFPVNEVSEAVRNHRRIGIGCVGWAETLVMLGIPYDSEEAFELAEKVAKTMYEAGFEASCDLAEEKGPFPLVKDSIWAHQSMHLKGRKKVRQPRNVAIMTFPPSSSNAVICVTSYGIEPYFALVYEQNVLGGMRLRTVVPMLLEKLKERGLYSEELVQRVIDNHGSIQGIKEIPADLRAVFKTAHDINWKDHIRMQAAFQKWTDNAITKTINMTAETTPSDIREAYVLAWKLGCKGLTVYRDRTKKEQVFSFGANQSDKSSDSPQGASFVSKKASDAPHGASCPDCSTVLVKDKKCWKCKGCGWSTCEL
jgi:ribonucleoside-diphosphate reductase alpha chain